MSEKRLIELKDYFLAYPDTAYLPNMFSEVVQVLEQLQKENQQLKQENNQLKEVIEEVREYIKEHRYITDKVTDEDSIYYGQEITLYAFNDDNVMELLQILDKAKESE